jgi:hypothetical protein
MKNILMQYQKHIEDIAEELNCKLIQKPNLPGMMYVELGYIEIPTIKNQIDYLTALHELLHFKDGHTQARPPYQDKTFYFDNGVLKSEAQAWEYTLDNCIDEITDESRRFMWDVCLGSYYQNGYLDAKGKPSRLWNGNRHHHEFIYDHPDEYFESIVKRIQGSITDFKTKYVGKYTAK